MRTSGIFSGRNARASGGKPRVDLLSPLALSLASQTLSLRGKESLVSLGLLYNRFFTRHDFRGVLIGPKWLLTKTVLRVN